jgi:hypothetical protein
MLKWLESRILWGSLLIIGGVLYLLENLGLVQFGGIFWAVLLLLGGLFFLSIFLANRMNWWALIPGLVLLSIGIVVAIDTFAPAFIEIWGGSIVLGGIGTSFLLIFLLNREMWWAIIPAGVLLSLAVIIGLSNYLPDTEIGGLFLIGLGLTFAVVAIIPTSQGQMLWAWIPAGVLVVIGLIITAASGDLIKYIWPVALILGGAALLFYTFRSRRA